MPLDLMGLDDPNTYIEYRGIRGGEKGDSAPIKTPPRVRMPIKNTSTQKFDVDVELMISIARTLGVENPEKNWATKVQAVPVFLVSDKIIGDDGTIYLERALYAARGRLCGSAALTKQASQRIEIKAYAQNKTIKMLNEYKDVECNDQCPLWGEPGKKTDCKFRAIVSLQLQDDPMFPSPSRHRTTSKNSIRAMVTSLKAIAGVTGGVLAGIPLLFRQAKIDVKDAENKTRRIPVMVFDFPGTIQELRQAAIRELASRKALNDAHDGEFKEVGLPKLSVTSLSDGEELDAPIEDKAEDENGGALPTDIDDESQELLSEIALLYKKLQFTPARRRAMEEKHSGNLPALLKELKALAPSDFNPSPGEPGEEQEDTPSSADDDHLDDLFE